MSCKSGISNFNITLREKTDIYTSKDSHNIRIKRRYNMKHYKILAMASMENEKKAEELLDNDSFKYMGTVLLDSKGIEKVMNTSVDALVIVTDVLTGEDTKLLERIYMSKKNLVMILLTGTRDIENTYRGNGMWNWKSTDNRYGAKSDTGRNNF